MFGEERSERGEGGGRDDGFGEFIEEVFQKRGNSETGKVGSIESDSPVYHFYSFLYLIVLLLFSKQSQRVQPKLFQILNQNAEKFWKFQVCVLLPSHQNFQRHSKVL